jgi:NAD(P)-dependent dehydrogenase (short-subunit alcohol dehydrogenase family)
MSHCKGTIMVTGANGGLGSAIASVVASTPEFAAYHGLYAVRNAAAPTPALEAAVAEPKTLENTPAQTTVHSWEKVSLELGDLENVRKTAAAINARVAAGEIPPIRALVLNAGLEEFATQTWTADGLDKTFAVNFLGHWLLTLMLLESMDREAGRIIWVSSWSHNPKDPRNAVNGSFNDDRYRTIIRQDLEPIVKGTLSANADDATTWAAGYRRYGASKLCGITMMLATLLALLA